MGVETHKPLIACRRRSVFAGEIGIIASEASLCEGITRVKWSHLAIHIGSPNAPVADSFAA